MVVLVNVYKESTQDRNPNCISGECVGPARSEMLLDAAVYNSRMDDQIASIGSRPWFIVCAQLEISDEKTATVSLQSRVSKKNTSENDHERGTITRNSAERR